MYAGLGWKLSLGAPDHLLIFLQWTFKHVLLWMTFKHHGDYCLVTVIIFNHGLQ